jgi:urea transporter
MAFAHIMGDFFAIGGQGYAIPGFTASFIFTSWFLIFASQRFGHDFGTKQKKGAEEYKMHQYDENKVKLEPLQPGNSAQQQEFKWTVSEFIKSTLKGVSQVTFVENWKTGIFWIAGLTLSFELAPLLTGNPTYWSSNAYSGSSNPLYLAGAMALLGSGIGTALSILMKIPTNEVKAGLHGYNQVLVMIGLTNFLPLSWQTFLYAILATVMCTYVMYFMQNFFGKWALPAFTGPFVITAWFFMFAVNGFHALPGGVGWARP